MKPPAVDVIIAVHSATRPIARAVSSVLAHTAADVRVTVVAHNIDPEVIRANLGEWAGHPSVRLLALADGINSPAGPLNLGLAQSTAPFTTIMGSDDEFEPEAIDSWLKMQRKTDAGFIIARVYDEGRGNTAAPPVRLFRKRNLDPVKDRLSYRSAPLGLISRTHFGDLRFTEGMASGEDLGFVTTIWFAGHPLAFDRNGPAYYGHLDEPDRVSFTPRPIASDFAFLDEILDQEWFEQLTLGPRRAICVKILRTSVFDAMLARIGKATWTLGERAELGAAVGRIIGAAPGAEFLLSRIDRTVLESIVAGTTNEQSLLLMQQRWNYRSLQAVVPRNLLLALHRQGPFRTLLASIFVTRRASWL